MRSSLTIPSKSNNLQNSPVTHKRTSSSKATSHPTVVWTYCSNSIPIPHSIMSQFPTHKSKYKSHKLSSPASRFRKMELEWSLTRSALQSEISSLRNQLASSQLSSAAAHWAPGPSEKDQISELCKQLQRARSELASKEKELQAYKASKQVTLTLTL